MASKSKPSAIETMVAMSQRDKPEAGPKKQPPTPERGAKGDFRSMGMAFRLKPMIDTLLELGTITHAEWAALDHYRERAHKAQDDEAQASTLAPERIMGGSRRTIISGPLPASMLYTPAIVETAKIERDLGELHAIAKAIAVDDMSLTAWCVQQHGGREKYRSGKVVAIVPCGTDDGNRHMRQARLELRMAAHRIAI